jgi:3,4-dihydroxy 2-butanone 4-phosphate synthase/GTP cyclohydrolase II
VLLLGDLNGDPPLVRLHSECLTGEVFGSLRCDCGEQLEASLAQIQAAGRGVLVYLAQEGRGIGLVEKLRAYELQDQGFDTLDANTELGHPVDDRSYHAASQILRDLEVGSVKLLTNNPRKVENLELYGTVVTERVALETDPNDTNRSYLRTKRDRLGHLLEHADLGAGERAKENALAH